jgi:hypothetical protein
MTLKVLVEALLSIDAQKLAHDDLDSQHLGIGKLGLGAALAHLLPWSQSSVRQKTAMMKVLRSTQETPSTFFGGF